MDGAAENRPDLRRDCDPWGVFLIIQSLFFAENRPDLRRDCDALVFPVPGGPITAENRPDLRRDCDASYGFIKFILGDFC